MNEAEAPPLTWRVWLLVPLVVLGLLGVAVPAWRLDVAPRLWPPEPPRLVPYAGELAGLLDRRDLPVEDLRVLQTFHADLLRRQEAEGGITESQDRMVRDALKKYRK